MGGGRRGVLEQFLQWGSSKYFLELHTILNHAKIPKIAWDQLHIVSIDWTITNEVTDDQSILFSLVYMVLIYSLFLLGPFSGVQALLYCM